MTRYNAIATKVGRWWVVQCVEFPGAISQVSNLGQAAKIHREAIAFVANVPSASVDVTVSPAVPREVEEAIARGRELRRSAGEQAREASAQLRSAAVHLHSQGWSMRDIGFAMGVSFQRVHQLLADEKSSSAGSASNVEEVQAGLGH
ncbi:MAG: hypothetical protein U0904_12135 [Candidatus Nanopelagicales bacterium]|nr:hypothetical protein [Candidatus Nanopelagicales bacterium]